MVSRLLASSLILAAAVPAHAGFEQLSQIRSRLKPAVDQLSKDLNLPRTITSCIK